MLALAAGAVELRGAEICLPSAASGYSAEINVGAASPLRGHSFFGNVRPAVGLRLEKILTPLVSLGAEADFNFNSSRWPGRVWSPTGIDGSYVGAYGRFNVLGFRSPCRWTFGPLAGAGWGHYYNTDRRGHSFFASRAGLFAAFKVSERVALSLVPTVTWNMSDADVEGTSAAYTSRRAVLMLQAGVSYRFGAPMSCFRLYDAAEVDALNAEINMLRGQIESLQSDYNLCTSNVDRLRHDLEAERARKPEIIKEATVDNHFNTIIDVFFHKGSSTVTADQMPNVERIAIYLKNNPNTRVLIKGYASRDGRSDANYQLAARRAEAVAALLTGRYRISPDRVTASGAGIGELFEEDSWNRVCVCTLTDKTQPPGR